MIDTPQIGTINNHYIQKARLKEFSWEEGNHHKIVVADLQKKKIGTRNIESAFYQRGLYSDDVEKEMSEKVEKPGMKIFNKVYEADCTVTLTRKELEMLKKYLLIQLYRNPTNISHYSPNWKGDYLGANKKRFKNDEEAYRYVSNAIYEICNKPLSELMRSDDKELSVNAFTITQVLTLFVRSPSLEFVINDLGSVCERQEYHGYDKNEIKAALNNILEKEVSDVDAEKWINHHHQFHDNFTFYPISRRLGIITLSPEWTDLIKIHQPYKFSYQGPNKKIRVDVDYSFYDLVIQKYGYYSDFIKELYIPCFNNYKSHELNEINHAKDYSEFAERISKYASSDDEYIYPIVDLDLKWAEYLNRLTINEAQNYFGFGSVQDAKISISNYESERLMFCKPGEAKHDLSWIDTNMDWLKLLP